MWARADFLKIRTALESSSGDQIIAIAVECCVEGGPKCFRKPQVLSPVNWGTGYETHYTPIHNQKYRPILPEKPPPACHSGPNFRKHRSLRVEAVGRQALGAPQLRAPQLLAAARAQVLAARFERETNAGDHLRGPQNVTPGWWSNRGIP